MATNPAGESQSLQTALRYASANLKVLPLHSVVKGQCTCGKTKCESAGKHPRLSNGAHGASSDPATITAWLERWPGCNLGITLDGYVVIDVDPRHSGDISLENLIREHGQLPATSTQATGGGGRHYLFKQRNGARYKGGLGGGVDLKHGPGQFIVVEPSMHASGNAYYWLDEEGPHEGGAIAEAPEWLTGKAELKTGAQMPPPSSEQIPAGGRNAFIYERCRRLRDLSFRQEEIEAAAQAINSARCTPPLTPDEVHTIAKSAAQNQPEIRASAAFVDSAEFVSNITPPQWLVDGIIQRSFLYGLTAQTNHGKTSLGALIAACVGTGLDFGNQQCEPGHVLYLSGENPEDFKLRLRGVYQANGINLKSVAGKVSVMPCADKLVTYIEQIKEYAESHPLALILIDTSVAYFSYQDENANVDSRLHAQDMRMLIQCSGSPAVIALCHPVKNAGQDNLIPRGGSAFQFELDCNLTLWKDGEVCELYHNKLRGPTFQPMQFKLTPCVLTGVFDSKGRAVSTVVSEYLSDSAASTEQDKAYSEADLAMRAIDKITKPSIAGIAAFCQWTYKDGRPDKSKAQRVVKTLLSEKLAIKDLGTLRLTQKGKAHLKD